MTKSYQKLSKITANGQNFANITENDRKLLEIDEIWTCVNKYEEKGQIAVLIPIPVLKKVFWDWDPE